MPSLVCFLSVSVCFRLKCETLPSEYMHGKVELIHLWASWCGSCRHIGMEMIPMYEQYKTKRFEVIGIAHE